MSQETWEILCEMEADDVELQLALQCAPLITGLKISNLLTISPEGFTQVGRIVESSVLSLYPLLETEEKMVILLYREDRLEKYLKMPQVQKLLREAGYESDRLEDILPVFCDRYETYAERGKPFPHELGLLLGYPPEDVEGFIIYEGKNSLCEGYWKVYAEPQKKLRLFAQYDKAREWLLDLLYCGVGMEDIVGVALDAESRAISQDYLFAS